MIKNDRLKSVKLKVAQCFAVLLLKLVSKLSMHKAYITRMTH